MSLINNMLKDLEKRKTIHKEAHPIPLTLTLKNIIPFWKKKLFILSMSMMILSVILSLSLLMHTHSPYASITLPTIKDEPQKTPIENSQKETKWLKETVITGITLQVKENITELSFLLNHATLYRLVSNDSHNQLSIIIDHSKLQSSLPAINYLNTAIQQITTHTQGNDTRFNLLLVPGASLKYVNLNTDDKNPELTIAIEYHVMDANEGNIQSNKLIKTTVMQSFLSQKYQQAIATAEKGNYQVAIEKLLSLLKIDPYYKDVRVSLTALLIDQGNLWRAKKLIDEGLKLTPDYLPFVELKARILTHEGKIEAAIRLLQNTQPPIKENPEYHALMAALYQQHNDDYLAIHTYQQLVNLNMHNGNWWLGLGISFEKTGKIKEAIKAYTKALSTEQLTAHSISYLQNRIQTLKEDNNEKG